MLSCFSLLRFLLYPLIFLQDRHIVYISKNNLSSIPDRYYRQCSISKKINDFHVLKGNESSLFDISIDPDLSDKYLMLYILYEKNISSLIHREKIGKYHLTSKMNGKQISISKTDFVFLLDDVLIHVYSALYPIFICPFRAKSELMIYCSLIAFISIAYIIYLQKSFSTKRFRHDLLIVNDSFSDLNQLLIAETNSVSMDLLNQAYQLAKEFTSGTSTNKIVRHESLLCSAERMHYSRLKNNLIIIFRWDEFYHSTTEHNISLEFCSEYHKLERDPIVKIHSLRCLMPLSIKLSLSHNTSCVVRLPLTALSPFQPKGQLFLSIMLFHQFIYNLMIKKSVSASNLVKSVDFMCNILRAHIAAIINDIDLIAAKYNCDDAYALSTLNKVLSDGTKTLFDLQFKVLEDRKIAYVGRFFDAFDHVYFLLIFDEYTDNKQLKLETIYNMMSLCVFVHSASVSRERFVYLKHLLNLICPQYRYHLFHSNISGDLYEVVTYSDDHKAEKKRTVIRFEDPLVQSQFNNELNTIKVNYGSITQFRGDLIEPVQGDCIINATYTKNEYNSHGHLTIIIEETTHYKEMEIQMIDELKNLDVVYRTLNAHKFTVDNNSIIMNSDSLYKELGIETPKNRNLLNLIPEIENVRFDSICNGIKKIFKVNSRDNPIFYTSISNGKYGYLFNINLLAEIRKISDGQKHSSSEHISKFLVWTVDPKTERVGHFCNMPTLWEVFSEDTSLKFTAIVKYIQDDFKDQFLKNYQLFTDEEIPYFTMELLFLKTGGTYQWHKLTVMRTEKQFICVLAHLDGIHRKREELVNEYNRLNNIFKSSKTMIWTFSYDDSDEQQTVLSFRPDISNCLNLNHSNIDDFVVESDAFREVLNNAILTCDAISFKCSLKTEPMLDVLFQGDINKEIKKIEGFCTDITGLEAHFKRTFTHKEVDKVFEKVPMADKIYSVIKELYYLPYYDSVFIDAVKKVLESSENDKNQSNIGSYSALEIIESIVNIVCFHFKRTKFVHPYISDNFPITLVVDYNMLVKNIFVIIVYSIFESAEESDISCYIDFIEDHIHFSTRYPSNDAPRDICHIIDKVRIEPLPGSVSIETKIDALNPQYMNPINEDFFALVFHGDRQVRKIISNEITRMGGRCGNAASLESIYEFLPQKIDIIICDIKYDVTISIIISELGCQPSIYFIASELSDSNDVIPLPFLVTRLRKLVYEKFGLSLKGHVHTQRN